MATLYVFFLFWTIVESKKGKKERTFPEGIWNAIRRIFAPQEGEEKRLKSMHMRRETEEGQEIAEEEGKEGLEASEFQVFWQ